MSDRETWMRTARRLALHRNFARWMDGFLPVGLWLTIATSIALLALRLMGTSTRMAWDCWGAGMLIAAVTTAILIARDPFTITESLVRLDDIAKLHNRLISTFAGVGEWPRMRPGVRDAVRWNWPRVGVPVLIGGLLLLAVSLVEVPKLSFKSRPNEEPMAWTQMQSWLNKLQMADLLDKPAVDKVQQELDDLRHQPEQDWYRQSSLEAGAALQQQTKQGLQDLQQNMERSSEMLSQAQNAAQMSSNQLEQLSAALNSTAQAMVSGNMPLNKELAGKMRNFDPSSLRSMSAQQLAQLQQRLNDGMKITSAMVGPNPGKQGMRSQYPSGHPGGGGTAPLGLDSKAENIHTKRTEGASNDDPSRAVPAEVLAITKGKHNVDNNTPTGPVDGGAFASEGQGGDAVWKDSLTPDEQTVLQKYFK